MRDLVCSFLVISSRVCVCVFSHVQLCNPMDYSLPGSSVHENFQAIILEWVAISYSGRSSDPSIKLTFLASLVLAGTFFTTEPPGKPCLSSNICFSAVVVQLCPTLCDPMDCGMPGFPVLHNLPQLAQTHVH